LKYDIPAAGAPRARADVGAARRPARGPSAEMSPCQM
jgi:hypothetical protein